MSRAKSSAGLAALWDAPEDGDAQIRPACLLFVASPSIPDFALRNPGYARSFPAHAGIQTGSPRSQGGAEIYRLLCNSDAAVQPRKDSHSMEGLD